MQGQRQFFLARGQTLASLNASAAMRDGGESGAARSCSFGRTGVWGVSQAAGEAEDGISDFAMSMDQEKSDKRRKRLFSGKFR